MWDLEKLERIVREKAAAAGDQKVLDLPSSELREYLLHCIYDRIYLNNLNRQKGES